MLGTLGFAFLAGIVSILSPCVLPLIPLVLGAALTKHKFGAVALAVGLAMSFTVVGLFVATIGFTIGIDGSVLRMAAAIMMIVIGVILIVPKLQVEFAVVSGPMANWADERLGGFSASGLSGQVGVGMLLGIVWAPCVGPTLGAASIMAARGENLGQVAAAMIVFGVGAAVPLLVLGMMSRVTIMRSRGQLMAAGTGAKLAMGLLLIVVGAIIVTSSDKVIETFLVEISPAWITDLTTRF